MSKALDVSESWVVLRNICGAQMLLGGTCITIQIILMAANITLSQIGHGVWGGVYFLLTGIIGTAASMKRTKTMMYIFLVSAGMATLIAIAVLSICIIQWIRYSWEESQRYGFYAVPFIAILGALNLAEVVLAGLSIKHGKLVNSGKSGNPDTEAGQLGRERGVKIEEDPKSTDKNTGVSGAQGGNSHDIVLVEGRSPADPPPPQPMERSTRA